MEAQSKKKMKNKARLPRTAGLRTLTDLTTDLTKAGIDPSRVQERAVMIAKMRAAGRKRKRDEDGMDVDSDDHDEDGDNWATEGEDDDETVMDVDGEDGEEGPGMRRKHKRGKANSGAAIARKGAPRSNRQLAGMRDEAVRSCYTSFLYLEGADGSSFSCGCVIQLANIQSDAITESRSARAQHACESGRERPRYQSQNGTFPFIRFPPGLGVCALISLFHLDANCDIHIFFNFFTILAKASLLWEAQGRQNQPPMNTWTLGGIHLQYILIDITVLFLYCPSSFHDIQRALCIFHHTR